MSQYQIEVHRLTGEDMEGRPYYQFLGWHDDETDEVKVVRERATIFPDYLSVRQKIKVLDHYAPKIVYRVIPIEAYKGGKDESL